MGSSGEEGARRAHGCHSSDTHRGVTSLIRRRSPKSQKGDALAVPSPQRQQRERGRLHSKGSSNNTHHRLQKQLVGGAALQERAPCSCTPLHICLPPHTTASTAAVPLCRCCPSATVPPWLLCRCAAQPPPAAAHPRHLVCCSSAATVPLSPPRCRVTASLPSLPPSRCAPAPPSHRPLLLPICHCAALAAALPLATASCRRAAAAVPLPPPPAARPRHRFSVP